MVLRAYETMNHFLTSFFDRVSGLSSIFLSHFPFHENVDILHDPLKKWSRYIFTKHASGISIISSVSCML